MDINKKMFKCNVCNKSYVREGNFVRHSKTHREKQLQFIRSYMPINYLFGHTNSHRLHRVPNTIQLSSQVCVPYVPAGPSNVQFSDMRPVGDVDDVQMTAKENIKNSDTMLGKNELDVREMIAISLGLEEKYNRVTATTTIASKSTTSNEVQKLNECREDVESEKGRFSWKLIKGFHVPYIIRLINGERVEFISARMAETHLLKKYLTNLHVDIYTKCTSVKSIRVTDVEANLLNDINYMHTDSIYGKQKFSKQRDFIVRTEDIYELYGFFEICYKTLMFEKQKYREAKCGFIRINSEFVVPYCIKDDQKYVPLLNFEEVTDEIILKSIKVKYFDFAYLKFCCLIQGTIDSFIGSDSCIVVSLNIIQNYLPPETKFEDYWPERKFYSHLLIKNNSCPAKSVTKKSNNKLIAPKPTIPQNLPVMMSSHRLEENKHQIQLRQQPLQVQFQQQQQQQLQLQHQQQQQQQLQLQHQQQQQQTKIMIPQNLPVMMRTYKPEENEIKHQIQLRQQPLQVQFQQQQQQQLQLQHQQQQQQQLQLQHQQQQQQTKIMIPQNLPVMMRTYKPEENKIKHQIQLRQLPLQVQFQQQQQQQLQLQHQQQQQQQLQLQHQQQQQQTKIMIPQNLPVMMRTYKPEENEIKHQIQLRQQPLQVQFQQQQQQQLQLQHQQQQQQQLQLQHQQQQQQTKIMIPQNLPVMMRTYKPEENEIKHQIQLRQQPLQVQLQQQQQQQQLQHQQQQQQQLQLQHQQQQQQQQQQLQLQQLQQYQQQQQQQQQLQLQHQQQKQQQQQQLQLQQYHQQQQQQQQLQLYQLQLQQYHHQQQQQQQQQQISTISYAQYSDRGYSVSGHHETVQSTSLHTDVGWQLPIIPEQVWKQENKPDINMVQHSTPSASQSRTMVYEENNSNFMATKISTVEEPLSTL